MKKILLALASVVPALSESTYQRPPQAVLDILHAPRAPQVAVSPDRAHLLLVDRVLYPPIEDLARPILRLGGVRIDPLANAVRTTRYIQALTVKRLSDGAEFPVALPPKARVREVLWSPDSKQFTILNTTADRTELWIGDVATGKTRHLDGVVIDAVMDDAVQWLADGKGLIVQTIPAGRGMPPADRKVPAGPAVQETSGRSAPVRTYEDLLQNPHDEDLFDYYATAQLARYDLASGQLTPLGKPAIFEQVQAAPDGQHLLVSRIHKPYSYLHPANDFPRTVEVWDRSAKVVKLIAEQPVAEIPIEGVRSGPRNFRWHPLQAGTLMWVEALDGGNPKETVPHRDRLVSISAPYQGEPKEVLKTEHRYAGLDWSESGKMLVTDVDRKSRTMRMVLKQEGKDETRVLVTRNLRDRYGDIGRPLTKRLPNGQSVVVEDGGFWYLSGPGASPKGDYPFLDRLDLGTLKSERVFQSSPDRYEQVVTVLDPQGTKLLLMRESSTEAPNLYVRDLKSGSMTALTKFADPAPQFREVQKQLVTYQRPDGVKLSFTLYLPPGYKPGTRLPAVFWAYPLEYNDASTAGQITGSVQQFTRPAGYSHLFFLLQGYAVMDNVAMPVVGDPETVNNTYVEQIVADAKAAIDKAVEMGVVDRNRVGVGGHSYGAFMTANLLAHCDFFRAGIARSGAYNRTLTPFGFQSERRTLWEAPETYLQMSPFLNANKIKTPILFIHGEADDNQGTFPIQSERMYMAVRGNGGTARLVMLPHEAHGYVAKESTEHTLYEMMAWFDKYVKNAQVAVTSNAE